jgi:endonuclease G
VHVTGILVNDKDVAADVKDAQATERDVFVAIRIGDAMGIQEPIKGLTKGSQLHLRGEWITREKAKAHGGERMSVLHFIHHPIGFICTTVKCYS